MSRPLAAAAFTGATVANLSPALAEELGADAFGQGVVVTKVAGGPAAAVGLQPGDIIHAVNGRPVNRRATWRPSPVVRRRAGR